MKVFIRQRVENYCLGDFEAQMIDGEGGNKFVLEGNGTKFFLKEDDEKREDLKIGELFTTFLYKKLGINSKHFVEYKMAEVEVGTYNFKGIISPNFLPDGAKRLSAWDVKVLNFAKQFNWDVSDYFENQDKQESIEEKVEDLITLEFCGSEYRSSVEDIVKNAKEYAENMGLDVNLDDIEFRLKQMLVLDFFLVQKDRHMANIEFYEYNGKLELCPIFDSEYALGLDHEDFYKDTFSSDRKRFRVRTGISTAGGTVQSYKESKLFKNGGIVAVDILEEVKHDKRLKMLVDQCLKIDINKEIKAFQKQITDLSFLQMNLIKNDFLKRRTQFYKIINTLQNKTGRKDIYNFKTQEK